MYNTKKTTKKFRTDNLEDMQEYDEILNDPLCSIISERKEKVNETTFNEEGRPDFSRDEIILVVTWEEKFLP